MWFQRAETDLKCLAHKGNDVVQVVVEEELENLPCGTATGILSQLMVVTLVVVDHNLWYPFELP